MKRASYKDAIDWIAYYDSAGIGPDSLDETLVSELITSTLIADIFDVPPEKVGRDVVRRRNKIDKCI
jgi:hypothetical protein